MFDTVCNMSYNDKSLLDLFTTEEFKRDYQRYVSSMDTVSKVREFLNSIEINRDYYKLNLASNLSELKLKTIHGVLNKVTAQNLEETIQTVIDEIERDVQLVSKTVPILLEKCILQKSYIQHYLSILKTINTKYDVKQTILDQIEVYTKLFQKSDEIVNQHKEDYAKLCEKNKWADNYIGFCEMIYGLESNELICTKCEQMIQSIFEQIQRCIETNSNDTIKYVSCLYTIYIEMKQCPPESKRQLRDIQSRLKDKKIIFKIMDILELP